MIHNTFLVRISTFEVLAESQYWPVQVEKNDLIEFITTREELRKEDASLANFPLIVGDDKFHGRDLVEDVILVFVTDKGEDENSIADRIDAAITGLKKRFVKLGIENVIKLYTQIVEPSVITRLKIALVGEGGVGKTTTLHLLMGDTPPLQYVPTIALNLETVENIRFGNYSLVLWDFAGQERFRNLWKFYFHGADVIFLVCDSSLRNVIISKDIHKLIKRDAPKVPVFALANKQDKPNAMKPEVVQKILGIPTYPMVAIDKSRRDEMLRILMTAAAQYVGVALPDLPASELLKFTDEATAALSKKEIDVPGFSEDEEEYEEVYVDEDGQIISASELGDEYEIVEEEEEILSLDEPLDEEEEEHIPLEPIKDEFEIEVDESISKEDGPIDMEITTDEILEYDELSPEVETETTDEIDDEAHTSTEITEVEAEGATALADPDGMSNLIDMYFPSISEQVHEEDDGSRKITRNLISEALDADDMITAEINKVSNDELDVALQAFSSDETVSPNGEYDEDALIADEALMELENILGSPDEPVSGKKAESEGFEDELDALDALFATMSEDDKDTENDDAP